MSDKKSLLTTMANRYEMEPAKFADTIKATCMPAKMQVSNEQFAGFLMVANEYKLNPLTKEIYAFPSRGGIQPIVSVDGWMKMINSHKEFDGMIFKDNMEDGKLTSITVQIFRKDRQHPIEVTEYMSECRRNTDTWKTWPARMLRHKAVIQAARYAFGFSGIVDPDEAERFKEAKDITPEPEDKGVSGVKEKLFKQAPPEDADIDLQTGEILEEAEGM